MRNKLTYLFIFLLLPLFAFSQQHVTQAEYFVDTDPGQGLATPMLAYDGNFNDAMETVIKSNVGSWTIGAHKIGVRVKDNNGNWGPAFQTVLMVQSPAILPVIHLSAGECFWDVDPGQGNGTVMLAFDGNFNDAMESVVKNSFAHPGLGMHKLSVRVKDVNNNWSAVFSTVISVQSPSVIPTIKLTAAECFWDADPGQGNGTVMLAFDGNFNDAMESAVKNSFATTGLGMHKLSVRIKDVNNNWSAVFSTVISVQSLFVLPTLKITAAELFWDTDPGQGNATAMLAFDGNFNDAYETAIKYESAFFLSQDLHVLNVRMRDPNNTWSPVFRTVVYLDACISTPTVTVTAAGPTTFCSGDSVLLNATNGFATYYWRRNGVPIGGNTSSLYATQPGNYVVTVIDPNGCPGTSTITSVNVTDPNPVIAGLLNFCQGDSVLLDAGAGYASYQWSTNQTTQQIYVSTAGTYTVAVSTSAGCVDTSAAATTTVLPLPAVPTITQNVAILTSSAATGNQWYLNGVIIPGATGQNYTVTQNGNYTVVVTGANGCSVSSAIYNFISTAFQTILSVNNYASVFPNPFSETGTLLIHATSVNSKATVEIYSLPGQTLMKEEVELKNENALLPLNRERFSAGTYLYVVILEDGTKLTGKFVVQ
jgi:hypothetical protein